MDCAAGVLGSCCQGRRGDVLRRSIVVRPLDHWAGFSVALRPKDGWHRNCASDDPDRVCTLTCRCTAIAGDVAAAGRAQRLRITKRWPSTASPTQIAGYVVVRAVAPSVAGLPLRMFSADLTFPRAASSSTRSTWGVHVYA
jgi:hypothetical protein